MLLKDKVAIVTGAASGIGAGTSIRMAEEGAAVIVADINFPGAQNIARQIVEAGGRAEPVENDISDEAGVKAMMEFAIEKFGSITTIMNNATPSVMLMDNDHDLLNLDSEMWDRAMAVALKGTMLCCKHVIPHMVRAGGGSIVNISSLAGRLGMHNLMTYQAAKAGIQALTRAIATRHGKEGVRCNAILPGFIETPAFAHMPPLARQTFMRHTMCTRGGRPDDIAYLAIFLSSDRAGYINGVEIPVDGGYSCHEPATADFMAMQAEAEAPA